MTLRPDVAILVLLLAPSLGAAFVGVGLGIGFAIGHKLFAEAADPPPQEET